MTNGILLVGELEQMDNKLLRAALRNAGIDGDECGMIYPREIAQVSRFPDTKVIVALGASAFSAIMRGQTPPSTMKGDRFIHQWRGSAGYAGSYWLTSTTPEEYLWRAGLMPDTAIQPSTVIIPTFEPVEVDRSFDLHPWLLMDLMKAGKIARGYVLNQPRREWFFEKPSELYRLEGVDLIAVDTEINPPIFSLTTESEVHVFDWTYLPKKEQDFLKEIFTSPKVLKVAHNWGHDHAFIRKLTGNIVQRPYFDTYGGAQILNTALDKDLSPAIATRFTDWPFHKWLVNHDPYLYCGIDGVVTYDSYWPIITELDKRKLLGVAEHDHRLLTPLLDMQAVGFLVDESSRAVVGAELNDKIDAQTAKVRELVAPVIAKKLDKFQKPHLFRVKRKCGCCGGGTTQRKACQYCSLVTKDADLRNIKLTRSHANELGFKTIKALKESFVPCLTCNGEGKVDHDLPFNPDSPDMVADVLYRGLGIRPRRFKGVETTKASALEAIKDRHQIVGEIVEFSQLRAEADTVERLSPGDDSRLHCVLDPWGTGSGRVGGKEGLVEAGTNPMNLPVEARRFVVADPGHILLYPDMNAIEARCVALLSGDPKFMDAFRTPIDWPGNPRHGKIDSHTRVMQLMLEEAGIVINRPGVKRLTYGGMYGGDAPQMTKEINAEMYRMKLDVRYTVKDLEKMLLAFFRIFRGVTTWRQSILQEVIDTKRLRCPFTGREFTWVERVMDLRTGEIRREIAKQIWSRLPQNMGAWVLGNGLIDLYYNSDAYGTVLQPLVHVHDALLMQCLIENQGVASDIAMSYLSRTEWGMPFPAEMKSGLNWLEASGG